MIQLNLIGEISVAGKTPKEIGQLITAASSRYFNNLDIQVDVAEYNSKFYAVFGTAVRQPGRKAYTGRDTVISAVAAAGFNERLLAAARPPDPPELRPGGRRRRWKST